MNRSNLYQIGKDYEKKGLYEKAYQHFLEAALSENDADAMNELGYMYYEGEYVRQDYLKAGYYYGMAFDNGADILDYTLIFAASYWENLFNDHNDMESLKQAMRYYKAAADRGVGYGNECLGKIYFDQGDYDKAYENLLKMDETNPLGFYYMGRMYDEGHVVEQNTETAIDYYKRAVEAGTGVEEYGEDEHAVLAKKRLQELGVSCTINTP